MPILSKKEASVLLCLFSYVVVDARYSAEAGLLWTEVRLQKLLR